jgi:hypothetical protein
MEPQTVGVPGFGQVIGNQDAGSPFDFAAIGQGASEGKFSTHKRRTVQCLEDASFDRRVARNGTAPAVSERALLRSIAHAVHPSKYPENIA